MIGTKAKKAKLIINNGITNFFKNDVCIKDKKIIIQKAKKVKIKCLEKKK